MVMNDYKAGDRKAHAKASVNARPRARASSTANRL